MTNSRPNPGLQRAVRIALAGSALAALGVAQAQTAPAGSAAPATVEEVVVTGSRIAVPNEVTISPVTSVSSVQLEQSGITRVEDMLNSLPQVFAAQGSQISNGSSGTATIDLRSLGDVRTLVLVNGRRLGPGDARLNAGAPDVNQIPAELIENIEVLTGGASSVYGADAVTGVVNFKLNNHFEGVKFIGNYGFNQHHQQNPASVQDIVIAKGDKLAPSSVDTGFTKDLGFMFGMNTGDGKGNATVYATYRNVAGILQSQYDYSACTLGSGYATSGGRFSCGGSSTSFPGRFLQVDPVTGLTIGGSKTIGAGGALIPYTGAFAFNYGPINYYQRPDERYTAGVFAHYEMSSRADVYTEIMYMNDHSVSQIAPSGAFFGTGPYAVNCNNPYLSASMVTTWCGGSTAGTATLFVGRRNVEGGGRQDDLEHADWRLVIGTRGDITDGWKYDAYGQYSITQVAETYLHDMSVTRLGRSLNAVSTANGVVCQSVVDGTDPNCVPWNIFQPGGVNAAALNYVQVPLINRGEVDQYIVSANLTGDLGRYGAQLPTAKSGLKVNFGVEWGQVQSATQPDVEYLTGDAAGQGAPTLPLAGKITSREMFVEARLPLIDERPGAQSLALDTGYRWSDYSLGFQTNTYKFGLEWSPIEQVRLRGSYARAVRAPNMSELFANQFTGLDGATDPCAGAAPLYTAAQCAQTGVTAAQYGNILANPASQYYGFQGGNPNLKPEIATTKSFGVGLTPAAVPGLRFQVDYFDINIDNTINTIGADNILKLCLNSGTDCNLIHRDVNGSLWLTTNGYVTDLYSNSGGLLEKGWDLDLAYSFKIGAAGRLSLNLIATKMTSYTVAPVQALPSLTYDCAGFYGPICGNTGGGGPLFKWRHTLHATWSTPWRGTDVTLSWRYFDSAKIEQLSSNPNLAAAGGGTVANGGISSTDAVLPSRSYIDLTASFELTKGVKFRIGVNNLLDKDPPLFGVSNCVAGPCNGNTFPQVYDSLGRYVFGTVTASF